MNSNIETFGGLLDRYESFIITGHEDPDGDCLGSSLSLGAFLKRKNKNVFTCSAGPFSRPESAPYEDFFLKDIPSETDPQKTLLILVDCSSLKRTGFTEEQLSPFPFSIIDHHQSALENQSKNGPDRANPQPVFSFIDPESPSCTLLIHRLLISLNETPTAEEAELIFFGFCTDTDFFKHLPEGKGEVFSQISLLCDMGISPQKMFKKITPRKKINSQILSGRILSRTSALFNGKLLVSFELAEDRKELNLEDRDSKQLYEMLFSTEGCEAVILVRGQENGDCSVGLRSIDNIDVSVIARKWNGGGHKNASGCLVENKTPKETIDILVEEFRPLFS